MTEPGSQTGAVSVRGIVKRFGPMTAVDDVTFDLAAGTFFSLLGPSGCGKTTLMRVVAGLENPDQGHVMVDGTDITPLPPERRPFNMVFQRYALFPHLTVLGNLAFGLTTDRSARLTHTELLRRVRECLSLVRLDGLEERYPSELSGGQQQRVALARALVRRPQVLLLDEPMSALDRNVRAQVREELMWIHKELGTTFILVTHDQEEALSISNTVGLMNGGRLEQIASPEALYRMPKTLFAAKFIGAGSFVKGVAIRRDQDSVHIEVDGIKFRAAITQELRDGAVQIMLRPEDLIEVEPGRGRLNGSVLSCAFLGSYYDVSLQTDVGRLKLHSSRHFSIGDSLGVDWPEFAGIAYPDEVRPEPPTGTRANAN